MRHLPTCWLFLLGAVQTPLAAQTTANLPATADATLYEDSSGSLASGSGTGLFAGVTGRGGRRRGLVHFDLSSLPTGAQVVAVELRLFVSRSNWAAPLPVALHRALASWGEGPSVSGGGGGTGGSAAAGDATWAHRFWPSTGWQSLGGDIVALPSAVAATPQSGLAVWTSTPTLVQDVQGWLHQPGTNSGWLLRTEELGNGQVRRFDSREEVASPQPPELRLQYLLAGQAAPIGAACGTPPLALQLQGTPLRGNALTYAVTQGAPGALGACFFGIGLQPTSGLLPGCTFWPAQPFTPALRLVDAAGAFQETVPLPLDPAFTGLPLAAQALTLLPATAALQGSPAILAVVL